MQKYLLKNKLSTWLNILIILSPHCNKENNSCVDDYFQWFELLFFVGIFTNGIFVRWLGFFFSFFHCVSVIYVMENQQSYSLVLVF